ncbi:hypothetical protein CEXT_54001 [Caerostris extrusa]|uniref:Uncharacterized protein n=1 Tax=Caerostris extrusa TaxID=172846 RepID=A0AAV4TUX4_CAEEX|nr:hypothetical protein CEXT_54001 [Caerostris extrusa]
MGKRILISTSSVGNFWKIRQLNLPEGPVIEEEKNVEAQPYLWKRRNLSPNKLITVTGVINCHYSNAPFHYFRALLLGTWRDGFSELRQRYSKPADTRLPSLSVINPLVGKSCHGGRGRVTKISDDRH